MLQQPLTYLNLSLKIWRRLNGGVTTLSYLLIPVWTKACGLIVLLTVNICWVVKGLIATSNWSPPLLVLKMPVEAGERSVLLAFVLEKQWTLFNSELLQVPASRIVDKFAVEFFQRFLYCSKIFCADKMDSVETCGASAADQCLIVKFFHVEMLRWLNGMGLMEEQFNYYRENLFVCRTGKSFDDVLTLSNDIPLHLAEDT